MIILGIRPIVSDNIDILKVLDCIWVIEFDTFC